MPCLASLLEKILTMPYDTARKKSFAVLLAVDSSIVADMPVRKFLELQNAHDADFFCQFEGQA